MRASDRRRVQLLAGIAAGDAVFDVVARDWVRRDLERLDVPLSVLPVLVGAKASAAVGLLLGLRRRGLGLLTSGALVLYFVLAVGAHVRARDEAWRYGAAIGMLGAALRFLGVFRRAEQPA